MNREETLKYLSNYGKKYHQLNKNKKSYRIRRLLNIRNYRERNREKIRERNKSYYKNNKFKWLKYKREKIKVNAHSKARSKIRYGKWIRKTNCEKCGKKKFTVMHHENYSKPLDVIFLCRSCHGYLHIKPRLSDKTSSSPSNKPS